MLGVSFLGGFIGLAEFGVVAFIFIDSLTGLFKSPVLRSIEWHTHTLFSRLSGGPLRELSGGMSPSAGLTVRAATDR